MSFAPTNLRPALLQKEAAEHLGVSIRTLLNWRNTNHGPQPVRDSGRWLYDRAEVEAFARGAR